MGAQSGDEDVDDRTRARREIVHDLGALALQRGDAAEAEQLLAAETARPDAMPASLFVRALALQKLGRREEAALLLARVPENARPR